MLHRGRLVLYFASSLATCSRHGVRASAPASSRRAVRCLPLVDQFELTLELLRQSAWPEFGCCRGAAAERHPFSSASSVKFRCTGNRCISCIGCNAAVCCLFGSSRQLHGTDAAARNSVRRHVGIHRAVAQAARGAPPAKHVSRCRPGRRPFPRPRQRRTPGQQRASSNSVPAECK